MARHTVDAQPRSEFGNGPARRLRAQGLVPGVLYQAGGDAVALTLDAHSLSRVLFSSDGRSSVIDLTIDGGASRPAVLTDWQLDPVRGEVQHVDFRPATDTEVATGEVERRREAHLEVFVASKRSMYNAMLADEAAEAELAGGAPSVAPEEESE